MTRILLLGGTTEAADLARALADRRVAAIYSYAGRTQSPAPQPLPTRIGGFGGVEGLARYLRDEGISHIVDATHPFAAGMSRNAIAAAAATGTPLCAFEREAWKPGPGDLWQPVATAEAAAAALPDRPGRVFLAIGRQTLAPFAARPHHHYLLRFVDPPDGPLPLPDAEVIVARGPFTEEDDRALLVSHRIGCVVAKNSGGIGARAKLDAARGESIPVIMIERPTLPPRRVAHDLRTVLGFLSHPADLGV
ncbi:MAG: cobalt-precorrin-6A reductase [Defluviimonas sp.]|uniref:cobalt-precorrin-6A reductase n=1 Tax=Albidovulum sp. TaxID=1872424 RepID=UPI001D4CB17A|nr:cobalt-precorrin-6A reductase [Paracoccaceae bacterium]MCC0064356.1 cobalt-precorrin-6A reductase [Defluviimonas sp.]